MLMLDKENAVLTGTCSGIAKALGIDPIIPRIGFLFLFFGAGTGVLLYLIMWLVMAMNTK